MHSKNRWQEYSRPYINPKIAPSGLAPTVTTTF